MVYITDKETHDALIKDVEKRIKNEKNKEQGEVKK